MTDFNERQLEELLQTSLPETSLVENLTGINPFGAAIDKIIAGMVMTTITLNFWNLNYIIPTIGLLLIYLGMRTLRTGNGWFCVGWLASMARAALNIFNLLLLVTPHYNLMAGWGTWAGLGLNLLFLVCLGKGIQTAAQDAELKNPKMATWPVIIWLAVMTVLALAEYSGWALTILLIYAWVKMLKHIYHCTDDLKEAGYVVPAAPVWFSAKPLFFAILGLLTAALIGLSMLCNYTPVDSETVTETDVIGASAEAVEIREKLAAEGFPAEVLNHILDEDLLDLGGAENITAVDALFEDNNTSNTERMDGWSVSVFTGGGRMKTFVWFEYVDGKHAGLVDSVKVQYDEYQMTSDIKARLFWEKKDETWLAEPVMKETENTYLWFGDISTNKFYTSKYSFPLLADNPHGYFTWWTEEPDGSPVAWGMNSTTFNCLRTPLVLPYMELPDNPNGVVLFGGFGDGFGQDKFQIYATPRFGDDE